MLDAAKPGGKRGVERDADIGETTSWRDDGKPGIDSMVGLAESVEDGVEAAEEVGVKNDEKGAANSCGPAGPVIAGGATTCADEDGGTAEKAAGSDCDTAV